MFCKLAENENFGIGKLTPSKGRSKVEFFVSPTEEPITVEEQNNKIKLITVCPETRAYVKDNFSGLWKSGRVLVSDKTHVRIQFPNRQIESVPIEQVFIRCNLPINNPVDFLAHFINHTPVFSESRREFVKSVLDQRRASRGMSGLISSAIELEVHQIRIVERILKDPIQRYLLADEVGLGKTIEAGVVIRQHVLDTPFEHKIVIIVPVNLVPQWKSELSKRFFLGHYLGKSIQVVSMGSLVAIRNMLPKATMLVVDEAHQLVNNFNLESPGPLYDLVCRAAHNVERLLLLSATPVFGNEASFLAMLHLLDPLIYSLSDLDSFKTKIANRQILTQLIAEFSPDNLFFLNDSLQKLSSMFPDDLLLQKCSQCLEDLLVDCPVEPNEKIIHAIGTLRSHVSETYRLHRRILRNRRRQVQGVTPNRVGLKKVFYESIEKSSVFEAIELWRNEVALSLYINQHKAHRETLVSFFSALIDATLTSPSAILNLLNKRLTCRENDMYFQRESEILTRIKTAVLDWGRDASKLKALSELVSRLITNKKIIIFCTDAESQTSVASWLDNLFHSQVAVFPGCGDFDAHLEDFIEKSECQILVCDQSAEEGLNLHSGGKNKIIIHYDLPFSPNRLEQRIGRLDRYGFMGDVLCYALVCKDDLYEVAWSQCLEDGFGVFKHSIATLQYLIDSEMLKLSDNLLSNGIESIEELTDTLGGESGVLSKELLKIDLQDQLDCIQDDNDDDFFDFLGDVDCEWEQIEKLTDPWIEHSLFFQKIPYRVTEPFPPDRVFRFQYNYDAQRNTLIPLDKFISNFISVIDISANRNPNCPRSFPVAYRRMTAISKGVQLLRYGNSFIDGMMEFTGQDDRGRSFAIWRYAPQYTINDGADHFFRFDFVVEVDIDPAMKVAEQFDMKNLSTVRQALKRQGDIVLPPFHHTIWLDADHEEPPQAIMQGYLMTGYSKTPRRCGSYDRNLNNERWETVWQSGLPVVKNWKEVCSRAEKSAVNLLHKVTDLQQVLQKAIDDIKTHDEIYFAQRKSRIAMLSAKEKKIESVSLDEEKILRQVLLQGIANPKISIDSVGVVFLSNSDPFGR